MRGKKSGQNQSSMPGTGEALRVARVTQRLTQGQIGKAIGQTSASIHYYEKQNAVPDAVIGKLPLMIRGAVAMASVLGHEAAVAAMRKLLTK